jgi:hypothetical protein
MRTPWFDKFAGSEFEQRSVSDAGPEGVRRMDAPSNPSLSAKI